MREANRKAFFVAAAADLGVEPLHRFTFSRDGAEALRQFPEDVRRAIGETFRTVGGKGELDAARLRQLVSRLRGDDCLRIDGNEFVVEYDERQHFTTFRRSMLASSLYDRLRVGFDPADYASVCSTVPKTGTSGFDHNESAHRDFACPGIPGDCRHRQRAF